jgi:PHD/YefM family antitoxin component YafN of YafNO toxin-antitoxin module
MYTIYHLSSAQEISPDILESIKVVFKSRPIVITVEDEADEMDATAYLMSNPANKARLDESLRQARNGEFIEVKLEYL